MTGFRGENSSESGKTYIVAEDHTTCERRIKGVSLAKNTSKKVSVGHNNDYFSVYCAWDVKLMNRTLNFKYWLRNTHFSPGESISGSIFDRVIMTHSILRTRNP